jgi:hypothetical protein
MGRGLEDPRMPPSANLEDCALAPKTSGGCGARREAKTSAKRAERFVKLMEEAEERNI